MSPIEHDQRRQIHNLQSPPLNSLSDKSNSKPKKKLTKRPNKQLIARDRTLR